VAELADAADSKSAGALLCVGSTPSSGTILQLFSDLLADLSRIPGLGIPFRIQQMNANVRWVAGSAGMLHFAPRLSPKKRMRIESV
jgi:hypothetical protein